MKEKILKQYDEVNGIYLNFGEKCKGIIIELLEDNYINCHQITSRLKPRKSLANKIDIKIDKYSNLSDITDICGIRVITYLESDVNKVAEIIEKEFLIDTINSIDKRKLKSDQFGYKSLHYVASLNKPRLSISENKKFTGLRIEIQIRSILQHAWAEIEHDLGYKGAHAIPENLKRNFNRLAALLETADIEFDRLKIVLSKYEIEVIEDIKEHPDEVLIDQASIASFTKTNQIFEKARRIINENVGCSFTDISNYKGELERFELFKIKTIGELERQLTSNEKQFLKFVALFTKNVRADELSISIPLFYFQHFLACKSESEIFVDEYFKYGSMKMGGENPAKYFIDIYKSTK